MCRSANHSRAHLHIDVYKNSVGLFSNKKTIPEMQNWDCVLKAMVFDFIALADIHDESLLRMFRYFFLENMTNIAVDWRKGGNDQGYFGERNMNISGLQGENKVL